VYRPNSFLTQPDPSTVINFTGDIVIEVISVTCHRVTSMSFSLLVRAAMMSETVIDARRDQLQHLQLCQLQLMNAATRNMLLHPRPVQH